MTRKGGGSVFCDLLEHPRQIVDRGEDAQGLGIKSFSLMSRD
jgi:hypothetical protein